MSLLFGHEEEEARKPFTTTGGEMRGPIDMRFWAVKNVPAPTDYYDAISKKVLEDVYLSKYNKTRVDRFTYSYYNCDKDVVKKPDIWNKYAPPVITLFGTETKKFKLTIVGMLLDKDGTLTLCSTSICEAVGK